MPARARLHKIALDTRGLPEGLLVEAFVEKTTAIAEHLGLKEDNVWDGLPDGVHGDSK